MNLVIIEYSYSEQKWYVHEIAERSEDCIFHGSFDIQIQALQKKREIERKNGVYVQ